MTNGTTRRARNANDHAGRQTLPPSREAVLVVPLSGDLQPTRQAPRQAQSIPDVISLARLLAMDIPAPEMLIEGVLPLRGASLLNGPSKSGKTIFAVQTALSVATGAPLLDYYRVLKPGPTLLLEQDDPGAAASVKDIVRRSHLVTVDTPFWLVPRVPFDFGPKFLQWLEHEIRSHNLRFCVLDSYTALRATRGGGSDIVKVEQQDLTQIDSLAKRTDSAILILHHNSKGSAALDWSQQAAGSFAMGAATESQIFIARFNQMESAAPERLIRIRGRHGKDLELVVRFRAETLDYEHVLEGGAAPHYPKIQEIRLAFGDRPFTARDFNVETGAHRATGYRQLHELSGAGVLTKRSQQYQLEKRYLSASEGKSL
jgi:RecA-family ATPase